MATVTSSVALNPSAAQYVSASEAPLIPQLSEADPVPHQSNKLAVYRNEDPLTGTDIQDFDLLEMLKNIENGEQMSLGQSVTTQQGMVQRQIAVNKSSPHVPIFKNCKI